MAHQDVNTVVMTIPADAKYLRPVRLAVGGVATMMGFDIEAIDDLRIGVDEICAALLESGDGTQLCVEICVQPDDAMRIVGTTAAGDRPVDQARFALSRQILSVVSDDFGFEAGAATVECWLERTVQHWGEADGTPSTPVR